LKFTLKNHGDLGKLTQQGTYYILPAPDKATCGSADSAMDRDGITKATYLEDLKAYKKKIVIIEGGRLKRFTFTMMYMSEESVDTIKQERGWIR
jgi:hypothetical protein